MSPKSDEFTRQVDKAVEEMLAQQAADAMSTESGDDWESEEEDPDMKEWFFYSGFVYDREKGTYVYDKKLDQRITGSASPEQGDGVSSEHGSSGHHDYTGYGGNGSWQGVKGVQKKYCRHEASLCFTLKGEEKKGEKPIAYHGGSHSKVEMQRFDDREDWIIVSVKGVVATKITTPVNPLKIVNSVFSAWSKELDEHILMDDPHNFTPDICITWPDFGTPNLYPQFWAEFHKLAKASGRQNVLFFCEGGHGRTGTALASILTVVCGKTWKDARDYVRKQYCSEAVEGNKQEEYLKYLEKNRDASK